MANATNFIDELARSIGLTERFVARYWRELRENKLVPPGKTGPSGTQAVVTPDSTMKMLIAILASETAKDSPGRVKQFIELAPSNPDEPNIAEFESQLELLLQRTTATESVTGLFRGRLGATLENFIKLAGHKDGAAFLDRHVKWVQLSRNSAYAVITIEFEDGREFSVLFGKPRSLPIRRQRVAGALDIFARVPGVVLSALGEFVMDAECVQLLAEALAAQEAVVELEIDEVVTQQNTKLSNNRSERTTLKPASGSSVPTKR